MLIKTNFIFCFNKQFSNYFNIILISYQFGNFYFKFSKLTFNFFVSKLKLNLFWNYQQFNQKVLNNFCLGFILPYCNQIAIAGSNLKITCKYNTYVLRVGKSNKHVLLPFQNFKLFLLKKSIVFLIARHFNLIKIFIQKWKSYYLKNTYKKKGLYFKHQIVVLKLGKIAKL